VFVTVACHRRRSCFVSRVEHRSTSYGRSPTMRVNEPDQTAPMPRVKIAGIAGSLRGGSYARSLLYAAEDLLPSNVDLAVWEGLGDVPLFNEDLESGPVPSGVADMRETVAASDAVLIVTPEYNQSVPGVLKNALDWASRPYGQSVLTGKPIAVVGTSPLPTGAGSALADVERVVRVLRADVVEAELTIPAVHTRFDDEGHIADAELATRMGQLFTRVVDAVVREPQPLEAIA
jgi:chromate reductase, NAD(P)H dehydrogenase (quinone)